MRPNLKTSDKPKKKTIICLDCDGEGINEKGNKCSVCKGTGSIEVTITKTKSFR